MSIDVLAGVSRAQCQSFVKQACDSKRLLIGESLFVDVEEVFDHESAFDGDQCLSARALTTRGGESMRDPVRVLVFFGDTQIRVESKDVPDIVLLEVPYQESGVKASLH